MKKQLALDTLNKLKDDLFLETQPLYKRLCEPSSLEDMERIQGTLDGLFTSIEHIRRLIQFIKYEEFQDNLSSKTRC